MASDSILFSKIINYLKTQKGIEGTNLALR